MAVSALVALVAGCGGGGEAPKTDADAVAKVLKDAAKAVADGDGDKACGYLTENAQRAAVLQMGGTLGEVGCSEAVGRVQLALSPLEKKQIESLEPVNVFANGTNGSATMATNTGAQPGQGMSIQLTLQKVGPDWKVSGFGNAKGVPGA